MNAKSLTSVFLLAAIFTFAGVHVASARRAYTNPVPAPPAPPVVTPIVSPS